MQVEGVGALPVRSHESLRFSFNICQPSGVGRGCPRGALPPAAGEGGDLPALPTSDWIWQQGRGVVRVLDLAVLAVVCPSSAPEPPREKTLEPANFKHRKAQGT